MSPMTDFFPSTPKRGPMKTALLLLCPALFLLAGGPKAPGKEPLKGIHAYVCGLHFYNGDLNRQVVAHHFCGSPAEGVMQCVIYDANRKDARLIGIEYLVSAQVFKTLPPEEKKLWHSHAYEVKSGLLVAPELTAASELAMMKNFATTYGKTWHTWQVDRGDRLPLGPPQLMMGFTADGQVKAKVLAQRDQDLGVDTAERRRQRSGLPDPPVDPEADAWKVGAPLQLELKPVGPPPVTRIPMH